MDLKTLSQKQAEYINLKKSASPDLIKQIENHYLKELTFHSNAIKGNSLTARETNIIIDKKLAIGGKSIREHLEVINHINAQQFANKQTSLTEETLLKIANLISSSNEGYRNVSMCLKVAGQALSITPPNKIATEVQNILDEIQTSSLHPAELACEAHYKLINLYPFIEGTARIARIILNMILELNGYPKAIIKKSQRESYIKAIEKIQTGGSSDDLFRIVKLAISKSLDYYLEALKTKGDNLEENTNNLLRIGQIAKEVGERNSTIRHWTKLGLIEVTDITSAGYQLYANDTLDKIKTIKKLKNQNYSLDDIKKAI